MSTAGHRDAIADTGTSHILLGRGYGVRCEWCPLVFFGASKVDAMKAFRVHEQDALSARGGARVLLREAASGSMGDHPDCLGGPDRYDR